MPDNNLDFLQHLTSDGNLSLEHINLMLPPNEDPEEEIEENQEPNILVFKEPENDPKLPVIDGLDYLNGKIPKVAETTGEDPETVETVETTETTEELENTDDPEDEEVNHFAIFGKGLAELGKLTFEEGEDPEKIEWTQETFIEKFDQTVDTTAWNRLEEIATEAYGEDGVKLVEDLFVNKVPVRDYLASYQKEKAIEDLDISSERNQVEVVRYYLKAVIGEEDEDEIQNQLDYMKANETLESRAASYQQKLVASESKLRERMATEAQARQKQIEDFEKARTQSYTQIVNEAAKAGELNGLPFKKEDINKVLHAALTKEYTLQNGQKITPFEYKLATLRKDEPAKYLQIVKLVEDGLDLNPVMKKGVTEKTNEIFKGLQNKTKTSSIPKKNTNVFNKYVKGL